MPPTSPLLAADCVVFDKDQRGVVLIKRKNEPFKGQYALPGGGVEVGETVEAACIREMKEETNLDIKIIKLIGVYSDPGRDPRGHCVSVAFLAEADLSQLKAGSDAAEAELVRDWQELKLAFDHNQILRDAHEIATSARLRRDSSR